jgi:hypothetical protein
MKFRERKIVKRRKRDGKPAFKEVGLGHVPRLDVVAAGLRFCLAG